MSDFDLSKLTVPQNGSVTVVTEKTSSNKKQWGLVVVLAIIIIAVVVLIIWSMANPQKRTDIKLAPDRPTKMGDCGYPNKPRGWYDTKNRGVRNDYCRYVGDWPGTWSCYIQGVDGKDPYDSNESEIQYNANDSFDPYSNTMQGFNCQ